MLTAPVIFAFSLQHYIYCDTSANDNYRRRTARHLDLDPVTIKSHRNRRHTALTCIPACMDHDSKAIHCLFIFFSKAHSLPVHEPMWWWAEWWPRMNSPSWFFNWNLFNFVQRRATRTSLAFVVIFSGVVESHASFNSIYLWSHSLHAERLQPVKGRSQPSGLAIVNAHTREPTIAIFSWSWIHLYYF
jgi:hypothetical protein